MKTLTSIALALMIPAASLAGEIIKRGMAIDPNTRVVPLEDVLQKPDAYMEAPVVVDGVITKACSNKGCWMQLAPEAGQDGVRVTFKDYGFFVPIDSKGVQARAEGVASLKKLSKKDADHLEGEGAKLSRNADGTANEVSFVASGVELRR
ncbi:MAG TPA: DUF4920 domain-containing protein [Thermoanaerobaculia bacterium]|nr:DUF4920 domain-containing protein [Thermoanaerobaculia bacterium]